jgi:hypothetical protein
MSFGQIKTGKQTDFNPEKVFSGLICAGRCTEKVKGPFKGTGSQLADRYLRLIGIDPETMFSYFKTEAKGNFTWRRDDMARALNLNRGYIPSKILESALLSGREQYFNGNYIGDLKWQKQ